MKSLMVSRVALLAVVLAMMPALARPDEKEPTFAEQFTAQLDEWLPRMGAEKIQDRRDSQQKLQDLIFGLGGPPWAALLLTLPATAGAQNLIANGSFENGLKGWRADGVKVIDIGDEAPNGRYVVELDPRNLEAPVASRPYPP